MTAEIGVLSPIGVALATDSAVSVGLDASKIFTSADKLFELSERAPVGVMVYGSAGHLNIAWETTIKLYRRQLGDATFPRLRDYVVDFVRYLTSNPMFPASAQESWMRDAARGYLQFVTDRLQKELQAEIEAQGGVDDAGIAEAFGKLIADEVAKTEASSRLFDLDEEFEKRVADEHASLIATVASDVLGKLPASEEARGLLLASVSRLLCRERSLQQSGVVLAGFGDEDYHPGLFELDVRGHACDRPLLKWGREAQVGYGADQSDAFVIPFAQTAEAWTFIQGIDPRLKSSLPDSVGELIDGVARTILDKVGTREPTLRDALAPEVEARLAELKTAFNQKLAERLEADYSSPVLRMVGSLPKDELGSMAESLVNLSRFRRRVSSEKETVGGPIDVAVITKADGFIWLRRKHYFRPELNLRHLARYDWGRGRADGGRETR